MNVKELKKLIQDIPDEAKVYLGDEDICDSVKATDVYYALNGTFFRYRDDVLDKSKVKAIEITGFFD